MTVRKKSQSKTRMQGKTSYRPRYVELAHQGFRLRAAFAPVCAWSMHGRTLFANRVSSPVRDVGRDLRCPVLSLEDASARLR